MIRIDGAGNRPERSGVLVVRAWLERGHQDRLRVRLIPVIQGVARPDAAAASVDDACAVVRRWLEDLAGSPPSTNDHRR